jgi:hypothetical protein
LYNHPALRGGVKLKQNEKNHSNLIAHNNRSRSDCLLKRSR